MAQHQLDAGVLPAPPAICCAAGQPSRPGRAVRREAFATARKAVGSQFVAPSTRNRLEAYATAFFNKYKCLSNGKYVLSSHDRIERQQVLRALIMCGPDGYLH